MKFLKNILKKKEPEIESGDILLKQMVSGRDMTLEIVSVRSMGDPQDMYHGELQVIWYRDTIKNFDDLKGRQMCKNRPKDYPPDSCGECGKRYNDN